MKNRNPLAVFFLPFITFGIYSWYWVVKTKGEMNRQGENIPTAWIWLIPIIGSIWWYWKYSEGVEHVTKNKMSGVLAFVIIYFLGCIGQAIIQDSFNKIEPSVATAGPAGINPDASFGGPVQTAVPAQPMQQPVQPQPTVAPVNPPAPTPPQQNPPTSAPPTV